MRRVGGRRRGLGSRPFRLRQLPGGRGLCRPPLAIDAELGQLVSCFERRRALAIPSARPARPGRMDASDAFFRNFLILALE